MLSLMEMKETEQRVSDAIAAALKVEVEIIDNNLVRVAGTGMVRSGVGDRLLRGVVNKQVLQTGEHLFIKEPGYHDICLSCPLSGTCFYKAYIVYPIWAENKVIGNICLVAFDEEQKQKLMANIDTLVDFIGRMADLISAKVIEREVIREKMVMANRLETVVDSVYEGVLAIDEHGTITHFNRSAEKLFSIKKDRVLGKSISEKFSELPLLDVLESKEGFKSKEYLINFKGKRLHLLITATLIWSEDDQAAGVVATFRDFKEAQKLAYQIVGTQEMTDFSDIIGESKAIQEIKNKAAKIAVSDSTVLINGESGTGKEVFARAIHSASSRSHKPFIPINCGAIPEHLLESELFGYEEGAFTGARRGGKPGKFELAHRGTIFLDEIGNMSLYLQAKLLRVLQERKIERVGGTQVIPVDIRVIAATNSDLPRLVSKDLFREDLYYRLSVIPLVIPPLRERPEDISGLLEHYIRRYSGLLGKNIQGISDEALAVCMEYPWPGNIRELINAVEYAVNLEEGPVIKLESLPPRMRKKDKNLTLPEQPSDIRPLEEIEKDAISNALQYYGWSEEGKKKAAKALGISRATIYRKISKYNLDGENNNR